MKIRKAILLPDIHYPEHSKSSMNLVKKFIKDFKPDEIIYQGDNLDMDVISHWNKDKKRKVELKRLKNDYDGFDRDILKPIESLVGKKTKFVWLNGNHEDWANQYLDKNPELEGIVEPEICLNLEKRGYEFIPFNKIYKLGKLNIIHGYYTSKYHAAKTLDVFGESVAYGHCFDDKTELLTKDGWKYIKDVSLDEEIITSNLNKDVLEYNKIEKIYKYNNYKKLVKIKSRSFDLLVTPDHGVVNFNSNNEPVLLKASEVTDKNYAKFKICGELKRDGVDLTDDELSLIVWITADGSFDGRTGIRFHLKKDRKIKYLSHLLTKMGIGFSSKKTKIGTTRIYFNLERYKDNKKIIPLFDFSSCKKKVLPSIIRGCNLEQAKLLLYEYSITDGCRVAFGSYQLSTSKEVEADILQEVFVTNGMRCNKLERIRDGVQNNSFILSVNTNTNPVEFKTNNIETVGYSGDVMCVTVKNHTLLVRRNGRTCITQNTHSPQMQAKVKPIDTQEFHAAYGLPCLADLAPDYMHNRPSAWINGFGVVYIMPDGTFNLYTIIIVNNRFVFNNKLYK